jgi:hypothetical protein
LSPGRTATHDSLTRRQIDERPNRLPRALQRADFEPLCRREQEHHAHRFQQFPDGNGTRDGNHHEDVDVDGARANCRHRAAARKNAPGNRTANPEDAGDRRLIQPRRGRAKSQRGSGDGHQPPAAADRGIREERLVVFEPHPHPRLPNRVDHRGRRKLGSVVFDVKPLADDVSGNCLHTV